MKKIWNTITTMLLATKYSFSFCWRNARAETAVRLIALLVITAINYLNVQLTGKLGDAVQHSVGKIQSGTTFFHLLRDTDIGRLIILMTFLAIVNVLSGKFTWYFTSKWNKKLGFANKREVNESTAKLDVASFKGKGRDNLYRKIQELPFGIQTRISFSNELFGLLSTSVSFVLFGTALVWHNPLYAVILIIVSIPMMISEFSLVTLWWRLFEAVVPINKKRHILERPYNNDTIFAQAKMLGQMGALRTLIDENTREITSEYDQLRKQTLKWELVTHLLGNIGLTCIIIHAVWTTIIHSGGVGTLTAILIAAKTFQGNMEGIVSTVAEQWNNAQGVILIEEDLLGMRPMIQTINPIVPKFSGAPSITFRNVGFSYPECSRHVLKGVGFTIPSGKKVAIVGESGHGKTTIQALLARMYDPTSGSVRVDEYNLANIEPSDWHRHIGVLTQDFAILSRTIGEEIASSKLGEPISMERVKEAARLADFDSVVQANEKGYDTQIGTEFGGIELSGGQKQRLALARVFYADAPVMIFDEPDSKLDANTAEVVFTNILGLSGKTIVLITHHVSRAERCDWVVVMKDGQVAEQGTPSELMASNGHYTRMFQLDQRRLKGSTLESPVSFVE